MNSERIQLYRDDITSQLESFDFNLHAISYVEASEIQRIEKEYLSVFGVTIVTDNSVTINFMGTKYHLHKGACVLVSPGALFDLSIEDGDNCHLLTFNFDFHKPIDLEKFKTLIGLKDNLVYDEILSDSTIKAACASFDIVQKRAAGCYIFAKLALLRTISQVVFSDKVDPLTNVNRSEKSSTEEALVLKCHNYIINKPEKNVEVEELCNVFEVSQSYVYKCFKNVMNMSTKEFITLTKIRMTETALLHTNKSVAEIATENGYANSYQYSNIFKRVHGISPTTFRRLHRM